MENKSPSTKKKFAWLNITVFGIGLASLLSDWAHEIATTVMPSFLATMGVAAAWLGLIEGVSDGISSFAKLASGFYTDRLRRRKPIAVIGYLITTFGTASIGLATSAWHILISRSVAWLGRGMRTPVRKALLAAAVTPETYGRAFGFERMMDTLGAVVGPSSALILLALFNHSYPKVFLFTLIPGTLAALAIWFFVRETERKPVPYVTFSESFKNMPKNFWRFLSGVGLFGLGDFAHTLLILLAAQELKPQYGADAAAGIATALYLLRNVLYAAFSVIGGYLADRFSKNLILSIAYFCGALMVILIIAFPITLISLIAVFVIGGIYIGLEETLEDSFCAELVEKERHGTAFGLLATVNGVGDFASSIIVGALWSFVGIKTAFTYSLILFLAGAIIIYTVRPGRSVTA